MEKLNEPNETAKNLEEIRKQRLRGAYENQKKQQKAQNSDPSEEEVDTTPEETPEESQEKSKKTEKKLDNDQNNAYIEDESTDEVDSKDKELFERQFKGDPLKAVKSWRETQREYMKLRDSNKEKEEYLDQMGQLLESNPILQEAFEKAENNEDIESFLANKFQESKQDKPAERSTESKPNITNNDNVDEKTLMESGYLDKTEKEFASADEWARKVHEASVRYMYKEMPKHLATRASEEYEKQIREKEEQRRIAREQEQNQKLIEDRYLNGIERVSERYGFDFVNNEEHRSLLDQIDKRAATIRDLDNPAVIDEDAVDLATDYVLRKSGLRDQFEVRETSTPESKQTKDNSMFEKNQLNVNVRDRNRDKKPQTLAQKLRSRHVDDYERQINKRITTKKD